MVMPWSDVQKERPVIDQELQIFGSGLRGTRTEIANTYGLTDLVILPAGSEGEFEYTTQGRVPLDGDLARFVLEAEGVGYTADAVQFGTMQQLVLAKGDDIMLRIYAFHEPLFKPAAGQTTQMAAKVTLAHTTNPKELTQELEMLVNKAASLYGLEKVAAKPTASP